VNLAEEQPMFKRIAFPALILCCTATLVLGRPVNAPGYQEMFQQADLIVIATPAANADLPGPTTVPNIISVDNTGRGRDIPATRVETTFDAVTLFKGKLAGDATSFKLLHLKLANPADADGINAAQLIDFNPTDPAHYLMFLKLRADGSDEPFNGQTDPTYSIEKLSH
jgi:hypothetical protein